MSQQTNKELKLGELLRAIGAVDPAELHETIKLAVQAGLPLGRALVLGGHISEEELEAALEMQTLIRRNTLNVETAREAYVHVKSGIRLKQALDLIGWEEETPVLHVYPSRLGSLLFDAKLINKHQLERAQLASYENGMPLGRTLCMMGALTQSQLARALELQRMVRNGEVTHSQAVLNLHSDRVTEGMNSVSGALRKINLRKNIKLGELLMLAGIISESDIMNAIEYGLTSAKPLGDVLIDMGLVTRQLLNLALQLQESVSHGDLNVHAAMDALSYVASLGDTVSGAEHVDDVPEKMDANRAVTASKNAGPSKTVRLGELLKMSGFVDEADIAQAIELSHKYPALIGKMLVISGAIDEGALLSALRCQFLLRNGHITLDDAVKALQFARSRHLNLDDALDELDIRAPMPRRFPQA